MTHPDLQGKLISGWDAYSGDNDPSPQYWDGHGTAVAGVAAAVTGNAHGIKGIGADVSIMPVRVYQTPYPNAPDADMPHVAIKAGIETAAEAAEILNNSWVKSQSMLANNAIEAGIDYALGLGRVVIFAVGNEGKSVRYPALLSTSVASGGEPRPIVAVGATDSDDQATSWTNFGDDRVSVVAPGLDILTTDISGSSGYCQTDYVIFSGTSAAAPLVAGTAALVVSNEPTLSPNAVRERLQSTTNSMVYEQKTGHGRIDACRALLGTDSDCERLQEPRTPRPPGELHIN
jgi:subtilisin family serine protease